MEKGKYHGFYQLDDERYGKLRGFDKTYFTIEISDFDGLQFKGWVEDDISTGGMEGKGDISGEIIGSKIFFVKRMPYLGQLFEDKTSGGYGLKIDKTAKHPPIYYNGIETENNHYKGKYNFRYFGINIRILIWLKRIKTGGTWEMTKV